MKILLVLVSVSSLLFSKVYYAKLEPYELRNISANVSGLVTFIDEDRLGKKLSDKPYLLIDNELDTKELQAVEAKIGYLENVLQANDAILKNLSLSLEKKRENYKRIEGLKVKSTLEKDREFHDLITSENQYLATQKEIENLKVQISDLKLRASVLKRSIADKTFIAEGFVLYSLEVRPGQVVPMAANVAKIADTSKGKLVIYLDPEDIEGVEYKTVYIEGAKTEYKVQRLSKIADTKNISKYKAEVLVKAPKLFSKLLQVELRDE
ncbi:MAG: HlyD family efflux transporter periplasmic adaptor subunit [Sulfurimonadaceae bacterium]|jgi:multidrug efflux pump subunit AcrA (membrane-fusion protein)